LGEPVLDGLPRLDEDVYRAIKYVEDNPGKEGKKRQHWSFVVPYVPRGPRR
jgi:hypothetical protein